jgi:hypothetical protein
MVKHFTEKQMKKIAALVLALVATVAHADDVRPIATCGEAAQLISGINEGRVNGQSEADVIAHIRAEDDISLNEESAALHLVKFVYHNDVKELRAGKALLSTCVVAVVR